MSQRLAAAGALAQLTAEQRLAAGAVTEHLFIEAGPGTGKTTVSAQRFGAQRFDPARRLDDRAVVAMSFTRAATHNLAHRVQRLWGAAALAWPHRVVTLDTIMSDLLHDLLCSGLLVWPNSAALWPDNDVSLDIHDSWASFGGRSWTRTDYAFSLGGREVQVRPMYLPQPRSAVPSTTIIPLIRNGVCTHQDVRDVLEVALVVPECADHARRLLARTMRSLIVDEVFDANVLDLAVIEFAIDAGVDLTLVGDPWQALYLFRGARPDLIPELLYRAQVRRLPLTRSFRWRTESQRELADDLRQGRAVTLAIVDSRDGLRNLDVVLALRWKNMWELGPGVLPLAFGSFKGGYEEAAATLLLNHVTRAVFGLDATYVNEALTALDIRDRDVPRQLESAFQGITETLSAGDRESVRQGYLQLIQVMGTVTRRPLRAPHPAHTGRLALVQLRLACADRFLPGLTVHQAKGREWDAVGIRLTESERTALAGGLALENDSHRKLYVACTRARCTTVEVRSYATDEPESRGVPPDADP